MKINDQRGFSLIEMLVVILITGIVTVVISNSLLNTMRLTSKYDRPMPHYEAAVLDAVLVRDLELCSTATKNEKNGLILMVPMETSSNRFIQNRIVYERNKNGVLRRTSKSSRQIFMRNSDFQVKFSGTYKPSSFEVIYFLGGKVTMKKRIRRLGN